MKRQVQFALIVVLMFGVVGARRALAAPWMDEQDNGNGTKSCVYADGGVIVVVDWKSCPTHN